MNKKIVIILILLMCSAVYAATRSLVPRADSEGGLGTSAKSWATAYIDSTYTDLLDADGAVDMDYGSADVTDHSFTTNDCTFIIDGGITVSTGDTITLGSTAWNSSDNIDGEVIANDTIDNDSIDWGDMTDLTTDGAVSWGNIAEGELADSAVVSADVKDGVITEVDLNVTNSPGAGEDNYVLTYNHAATNFTWAPDADTGGATAYDDIGDPDAASSITFADGETVTWATAEDSAGPFFLIQNSDADLAANTYLLDLDYSVDDNQANADYFRCQDAGGVVFSIQENGNTVSTGTIQGTTLTGSTSIVGPLFDAAGDEDLDIGSADVDDITLITDGGTYIFDDGLTAIGEDLGSTAAEWDDLFLNDGGKIQLGDDQDVTLTHVADTGVQVELDDKIMFGDTAVYIHSDDDGYLDIEADTGIRMDGPVDMQANALDLDSCTTTLSTVSGAIDAGGATSLEIPNSADPDVDAVGEVSEDTDGANETGDVSYRGFDGTNQFLRSRKLKRLCAANVVKPNDFADATRDKCMIGHNNSGMTFTVVQIMAWADTDDTDVNVEEYDEDGVSNNATIDAITCTTGSGPYTDDETTITGATIEHGHTIFLDFDDTDDPGWVYVEVWGWFNADVN